MDKVLPQELVEYVKHGREERNLEYKETLDLGTRSHCCRLSKSAMGMSNVRYGGVIVIGVRDDGTAVGLSETVAAKFTQDQVQTIVNEYAAPFVEVTVTGGTLPGLSGWFVVIQVNAFTEYPTLCRKDGDGLRQGAMYTRGRRRHETAEVRTEAELREIIEMAVENGIRGFYRRAEAAGLEISTDDTSQRQFDRQLEGL